MKAAPEIKVQDVPQSAVVRTWILKRVKKLAARHPDITKCRVAVDTPHKSQLKGRQFRVQIDIAVPGLDVVATNHPDTKSEKIIPALHEAFQRSERQLEQYRTLRLGKARRSSRKNPNPFERIAETLPTQIN